MALEEFQQSESLTLGVELELQLVNLSDFDLSPSVGDMLHLLGRNEFPGDVKPEITEGMLEIATGVHSQHETLLAQLRTIRAALLKAGDYLNVAICGGGTHPFQHWPERRIFTTPRFLEISEMYGYLAKQFTVFGQHIHVGCTSADEALYLLHALNRYLPHFIALSASSPFSQGVDTLFDSSRLNSVFAFPLSGRAPFILNWKEFEAGYFAKLKRTGVVKSMKDFYWDIRPKPEFGTIELRVCDTPLTIERAAALAAYLQALCRMLLERAVEPPEEDNYLVYNYNRFQACRFGLDGSIVHPSNHQVLSLREDILTTLRLLEPHATALGSLPAFDELRQVLGEGGNHASYLRRQYNEEGSIEGAVDAAVRIFRGEA